MQRSRFGLGSNSRYICCTLHFLSSFKRLSARLDKPRNVEKTVGYYTFLISVKGRNSVKFNLLKLRLECSVVTKMRKTLGYNFPIGPLLYDVIMAL